MVRQRGCGRRYTKCGTKGLVANSREVSHAAPALLTSQKKAVRAELRQRGRALVWMGAAQLTGCGAAEGR